MLHLFNKVYLDFDANFTGLSNSIIISPNLGSYDSFDDNLIRYTNQHVGTRLYVVKMYEELVKKHFQKQPNNFLNFLAAYEGELIIYCDPETFNKLFITFLKSLLPNITSSTAVLIYRLTMAKLVQFKALGVNDDFVRYHTNSPKNALVLNASQVTSIFSNVVPFSMSNEIRKNASVEYLLATYYANPTSDFTNSLAERTIKIFWKHIVWELYELKTNLLYGFFELDKMYPDLNINFETTSVQDVVKIKPELAFLLDDNFSGDNLAHVQTAYNIKELMDVLDLWSSSIQKDQVRSIWHDEENALVKKAADGTLTFEDVLAVDRAVNVGPLFFGRSEYSDKMNSYLVSYIYKMLDTNQLNKVAELSLVPK